MPAWPPCHRQVTFGQDCSRELALGHTVAPDTALPAYSKLRAYTGPSACCFPALSLPSALSSPLSIARRGLRRRGLHCCGLRRCGPPPPTPQSVTCSNPGLALEASSVFKTFTPPGCVHPGGITGQLRRTATRAGCLSCWDQGPWRHSTLPPPPFLFPAPPRRAQSSAGHRHLGVCVREAISEGVLWLGGHVRDWPRCREGEYALVSSRFTKTAHPACSPPAPAALGCTDSPEPKFSPQILHPLPGGMPAQKWGIRNPVLPHTGVCISVHTRPFPQCHAGWAGL